MNIIGGYSGTGGQVRGLPVSAGRNPHRPLSRPRKDVWAVRVAASCRALFRGNATCDAAPCAGIRAVLVLVTCGSGPSDPSDEVVQQAAPPSLARAQNVVSETSQWPLTSVA